MSNVHIKGKLHISQVQVDFLKAPMVLEVRSAIVNEETGATIAWIPTNSTVWSEETNAALQKFVQHLKNDIIKGHNLPSDSDMSERNFSGIGEHLSEDEAPQM